MNYILTPRFSAILFLILNLIIFSPIDIFGQNRNKIEVLAKFHPSALIALTRPSVLGSVELKYKKIGFDLAYGRQFAFLNSANPDTLRLKNFGNQYRADIKYYLNSFNDENLKPFISIGYAKLFTEKNKTVDWFSGYRYQPSLATIENIDVYYVNYGINWKMKQFHVEATASGGIRIITKESVYTNKVVYKKQDRKLPHLGFSFRVGYFLFKD